MKIKPIRFLKNYFKILRAMLALWLLKKVTHPENLPLTCHGRYIAEAGDVAVFTHPSGQNEIGEVTGGEQKEIGYTVFMRIYRRPKT